MRSVLAILGVTLLLTSCGWFSGKNANQKDVLARVGDKYLYASDLDGVIPSGTSAKDSIQKVSLYVENWIKLQLMVQKAELNLSKSSKDFEKEMENLRTTLLIHTYQEQIVAKMLDTVVSEEEIRKYYKENENQFLLRNNLVKASYVIFSRNARDGDKVKQWLMSDKTDQQQKLLKFCKENAMSFQVTDSSWQIMDELERIIPFDYSSQESFLAHSRFYETRDSSMIYMVRISDYKIKESLSPLEFERPIIKSLIINIRKQEILRKMEDDIYKEARDNKTFENFVK